MHIPIRGDGAIELGGRLFAFPAHPFRPRLCRPPGRRAARRDINLAENYSFDRTLFKISMNTQLASGTANADRRLPDAVETKPMSQGKMTPPVPAKRNATTATREAALPSLDESVAMRIGKTEENPRPTRPLPAAIVKIFLAPISTRSPTIPTSKPACDSFSSVAWRRTAGAAKRPISSAPQKNDGVSAHQVPPGVRSA